LNTCLYRYHLQTSPAQSTETGQLQLTNKKEQPYNYYGITGFGNLYLAKHSDRPSKSLIWLKNETSWVEQDTAFLHWKKYNNNTAIKFITADQPNQLAVHHELTIEGKLLSSRLINGVLYLLTQNSPRHYIPWAERDLNLPIVKPPLDFFFPALTENKGDKQSFVNASDCYIPPQNSARYNRPVISVLTAIPVDNPSQLTSRCVAGDVDTFYASTQAVYLVTSRYSSTINGSLTYAPNYTTDIHKFSLKNASIDYLGSGQVEGHLGWQQDKKSFRFGEDKNTLRVATSLGSNWSETNPARTKITILEEDAATQSLKEVGALDYLGKPGERLYAARFMGDRGYLVTFRVTDPLIVLDLSQTNDPKVLGELEVNGYSDYLQPIGNHYLLGIGKDAIAAPNVSSTTRGAFVQGVKLSLFDVSNAENLKEVSSMVIGKRGSESTVSSDHHGLTLLKTDDSHYKLTLPIELHENANKPYPYTTTRSTDSVHYNWTHTGLYSFDINTDAANPIQLNGKLISDSFQMNAQDLTPYSLLNDRSVIQGDTVHYIHGDKILSSEIKDLSQ
ncbi:MAG: beta-propeller domain-containing protein, partial [Methylococcales bacterium]|nr:beta-propeller domain-containing protein [Methylococcales bacterium]